jgi:hypothetical protein
MSQAPLAKAKWDAWDGRAVQGRQGHLDHDYIPRDRPDLRVLDYNHRPDCNRPDWEVHWDAKAAPGAQARCKSAGRAQDSTGASAYPDAEAEALPVRVDAYSIAPPYRDEAARPALPEAVRPGSVLQADVTVETGTPAWAHRDARFADAAAEEYLAGWERTAAGRRALNSLQELWEHRQFRAASAALVPTGFVRAAEKAQVWLESRSLLRSVAMVRRAAGAEPAAAP